MTVKILKSRSINLKNLKGLEENKTKQKNWSCTKNQESE